MRTTIAVVGLAALVSAKTYTLTETADVTVTSCGPEVTDCPGNSQWNDWSSPKPNKPDVKSTTWAEWTSTKPSKPDVKSTTWADWSSKPVKPTGTDTWSEWQTPAVTTSATWSEWTPEASAACPSYTEKAPPAWFSQLPDDDRKSMEDKWSAGPPKDWCYYTYSKNVAPSTPVAPATTPAAATSSWANWTPAATTSAVVAPYKGAANANGASLAIAGLAAAAAVVLA